MLNAPIGNFSPLEMRPDKGAVWENFLVSERRKRNHYAQDWFVRAWFWRAVAGGSEIDYLEEKDGIISAYEFKWNPHKKSTPPKSFREKYPDANYIIVNTDNFGQFL